VTTPSIGVVALLRENRVYRRFWIAELVSFMGDWFTFLAIARLVHDATGSSLAVGGVIVAQMAPSMLFSAPAGTLADRLPRRTVMITCDLLRMLGAFGFLVPRALEMEGAGFTTAVLALVGFQHALTAFFRPAASASVPALVPPQALAAAGTLDGLSWSLGLVVGSALGGLAADHLDLWICFTIDAATFLVSAWLLAGLPLPREPAVGRGAGKDRTWWSEAASTFDFRELFEEMRRSPLLTVSLLAKTAWGVGAAQLLLLNEFGGSILSAAAASTGFGLLYAARGLGTAFGPMTAHRLLGQGTAGLLRSIAVGFACAATFYGIFATDPGWWLSLFCVAAAHGGGSAIWISATVLVQRLAPDRVRGRAFALEMSLHTLVGSASALTAGALVDAGWKPTSVVALFAVLTAVLGSAWCVLAWRAGADKGPIR